MRLLSRHGSPCHPSDFDAVPDGHRQWHDYIGRTLADAIENIARLGLVAADGRAVAPRLYDASTHDPGGPAFEVPVRWNAFPRQLLGRFGRAKAMAVADMLWPLSAGDDFDPLSPQSRTTVAEAQDWMRPQDEYCEWRVERDPATQDIHRVVFTTEAPEYWHALHGGVLPHLRTARDTPQRPVRFQGSPQHAAALYGRLLGQQLAPADIEDAQGGYRQHNRWNTTHGIVHLTHPVNALCTLTALIADSTLAVRQAGGSVVTHAEALCASLPVGDPNNHSDPVLVSTVNTLVRQGAWVTLADPIGITIADIDTSGWELPGGMAPEHLLHQARSMPGGALRLVVQAPPGCGVRLRDLVIGGEPLQHGGQIAECITVQARLVCRLPAGPQRVGVRDPVRSAFVPAANPALVLSRGRAMHWLAGCAPAFEALPGAPLKAAP